MDLGPWGDLTILAAVCGLTFGASAPSIRALLPRAAPWR